MWDPPPGGGEDIKYGIDGRDWYQFNIAIHDAALANLIFGQPQRLSLLEIHPPVAEENCFKIMAETLDMGFERIFGFVEGEYFDKRQSVSLDEGAFTSALNAILRE